MLVLIRGSALLGVFLLLLAGWLCATLPLVARRTGGTPAMVWRQRRDDVFTLVATGLLFGAAAWALWGTL